MNVSMKLTMDGLVRALRWKAHEIAEDHAHAGRRPERPAREVRHEQEEGQDERRP